MARQLHGVATVPTGVADLLEALPVAGALLDGRGRILALNAQWRDIARPGGLAGPDDQRGQDHLHSLETERGFAHDAAKRLALAIRRVLAGQDEQVRVPYQIQDTRLEAVVFRGDGAAFECVVFHVDRTAEVNAEETAKRLDTLRVEHTALLAWRDDHLDRLAARLRATHGPMTPVRIHLHLLKTLRLGPLTPEQRATIDSIDTAVARWCALQDSAIAQADGGASLIDLAELAKDVTASVRSDALRYGVQIQESTQASVAEADATLRPAVLAILRWLVRHAPAGSHVQVAVAPQSITLRAQHTGEEGLSWPGLKYAQHALAGLGGETDASQDGMEIAVTLRLPET